MNCKESSARTLLNKAISRERETGVVTLLRPDSLRIEAIVPRSRFGWSKAGRLAKRPIISTAS
jgi:hypothetical protein